MSGLEKDLEDVMMGSDSDEDEDHGGHGPIVPRSPITDEVLHRHAASWLESVYCSIRHLRNCSPVVTPGQTNLSFVQLIRRDVGGDVWESRVVLFHWIWVEFGAPCLANPRAREVDIEDGRIKFCTDRNHKADRYPDANIIIGDIGMPMIKTSVARERPLVPPIVDHIRNMWLTAELHERLSETYADTPCYVCEREGARTCPICLRTTHTSCAEQLVEHIKSTGTMLNDIRSHMTHAPLRFPGAIGNRAFYCSLCEMAITQLEPVG